MPHHPIAITGMHRSGTSMITRALHDAGLHLLGGGGADDELIDAAEDNPEGFWENKGIVACNDDLLEAAGGAWDNPPALLPQAVDDPRVAHVAEAATEALAGLREHDHWGFKDPRTCLTARYWLDLEPELRFVVCLRHPLEVALSLKRRNQNSYSLGLALWERYYAAILEAVPADCRIVAHYDTFFIDPRGELARLCAFVGLDPVEPRVRSDLRHHTVDVSLGEADVSPTLRALYTELCREAGVPLRPEPPTDEGRVRRMILDGEVARRHADQRQEAIDRLHEREQELRREASAAEADHRLRVRELEVKLAETLEARARAAVRRGRRYVLRGRRAVQEGKRAAVPKAKAAAGRLPPPAQDALRRGRSIVVRLRARSGTARRAPQERPVAQPPPPPKGPAIRRWKAGYEQLVAASVPAGAMWLVVQPGSPSAVRQARSPRGTPFPNTRNGEPLATDLAHVAHLEALRFQGHRHLVLPEGSRPWFRRQAELRDHVTSTYRTVADREQAGSVFDLAQPPESGSGSLRAAVAGLTQGRTEAPAVLDWTSFDIAGELPGATTFRPPPSLRLPYLDASVDIVVIDPSCDAAEAARVASSAVITVAQKSSGAIEVRSVDARSERSEAPAPRMLVWSADPDDDLVWRTHLAARVAEAGAELRLAPLDAAGVGAVEGHDVVIVLEPYVLPLPSTIAAAAALAACDPSQAAVGKVIRADGRLEGAGGFVFFDRSVGLIANGSADVSGPWHDYVRPVCWGSGLLAAATPLWNAVPRPELVDGRAFLREWCAAAWGTGLAVRYQPTITSVRVKGDSGEASTPLGASAWQRVLDLRPPRPGDLSDGAWRYLLAHDDVEACRA